MKLPKTKNNQVVAFLWLQGRYFQGGLLSQTIKKHTYIYFFSPLPNQRNKKILFFFSKKFSLVRPPSTHADTTQQVAPKILLGLSGGVNILPPIFCDEHCVKGIPQSSRLRRYVKIHATIIQCAFPPFEKGEKQKQNKKFDVCLNRKYVENKRDPRGIDRQRYGAAKCQRRGGGGLTRIDCGSTLSP